MREKYMDFIRFHKYLNYIKKIVKLFDFLVYRIPIKSNYKIYIKFIRYYH